MKDFVNLVYQYSIKEQKRIKKLCEPLKQFGLSGFWHETMSQDGHFSCLLSEGELGEYFADNKLYKGHPGFRHPDLMTRTVDFPDMLYGLDEKYDSTQGVIRKKFQSDQILHLRERIGDTTYLYGFSSTPNRIGIRDIYINYTSLLWKFIRYFREEAKDLITNVYENQIHIAPHCGEDFHRVLITDAAQLKLKNINCFLEMIGEVDRIDFLPDFTRRELDCVHGYLRGLSARQLADELKISKRTVEHYLENVKDKLCCRSRAELFERLQLLKSCQLL